MRETKFRGMSIEGTWHCGNLTVLTQKINHVEPGHYISNKVGSPFAYQVRPETIGLYTGLKDNNNPPKEIVEGDIIRRGSTITIIEWNEDRCGFNHWTGVYKKNQTSFDFHCDIAVDCKVIGNIHENSGLLKGKDS